jgi:hypothetical protein
VHLRLSPRAPSAQALTAAADDVTNGGFAASVPTHSGARKKRAAPDEVSERGCQL